MGWAKKRKGGGINAQTKTDIYKALLDDGEAKGELRLFFGLVVVVGLLLCCRLPRPYLGERNANTGLYCC